MAEKQTNEEVIEAEVVTESETAQPKKPWATWLLILLLVIASGYLFWLYAEQQKTMLQLENQLTEIKQIKSKPVIRSDAKLEAKIAEQAKQTAAVVAAMDEQRTTLSQEMKKLAEGLQLSNADIKQQWALTEVSSLLNTANQQLLLAGNVKAALKAIELADNRVEQLDDFRFHPLRSLLAAEKMSLEEISDIDVDGMVLTLQAAINQVDHLQVVSGPPVAQIGEVEQIQATDAEPTWKQAVDGIWQQIRSLVVIRHNQDGFAAILVPEQRYFLYQNLKLKLETARFALLRYDVNVFKESVSSSIDWLDEYFVGSERDAMLTSLKSLQQVSIRQELPDISGSLSWLKQQGLAE